MIPKTITRKITRCLQYTQIRNTDVFIVSFPRSGNTWLRKMLANAFHPELAAQNPLSYDLVRRTVVDMYQEWAYLPKDQTPRLIKSHESFTKHYPKVVYLYRDGRAVTASYYHFLRKMENYSFDFDTFLAQSLKGDFQYGSWQAHIESWLRQKPRIPFHPVRYESLLENPVATLGEICRFLGIGGEPGAIENAVKNTAVAMATPNKKYADVVSSKWLTLFNEKHQDYFFEHAGETMQKLGYRKHDFPSPAQSAY